jgi:3-dehydroquinate synthase
MNYIEQSFQVQFHYKVHFTSGLFGPENPVFANFLNEKMEESAAGKIFFVLDSGVVEHHSSIHKQIREYFGQASAVSLIPESLIIPGGEACKNDRQSLEKILEAIDRHGIDRHSYLAAIGGGAVLDLAGYAAAIAHRGIRHIRIPTTVLSQNDSGVGVKNGINYYGKKNFLGTFTPPVAVFNDELFLKSLSERNWRSGISEAVKVSLIKDAAFFYWIEEHAAELAARHLPTMNQLIRRCAELHMLHISGGDPFEQGSSRPLDFGHWSAHKLEQLAGFNILHGEAVAIGIAVDTLYSALSGRIDTEKAGRVIQLLLKLGFEISHPGMQVKDGESALLKGLEEFREHLGGRLTIMLLRDIGKGEEVHQLDSALIRLAVQQLLKLQMPV